ncbi:MAG: hypothetical protein JW874_15045 [Spirochaetales bacterium]|nr:hypothetical protein [Spirochaetales bacterium]
MKKNKVLAVFAILFLAMAVLTQCSLEHKSESLEIQNDTAEPEAGDQTTKANEPWSDNPDLFVHLYSDKPVDTDYRYTDLSHMPRLRINDSIVEDKISDMTWMFFFNPDGLGSSSGTRVYYEDDNGMAYIKAIDSNDVRSEGMSYGMMICVQLGLESEFAKLWNWAKTHMRHPDTLSDGSPNPRAGYFRWRVNTDGSPIKILTKVQVPVYPFPIITAEIDDPNCTNPAPDGEEYFTMALYLAAERWGTESYREEAFELLDLMVNKPVTTRYELTLWDENQNLDWTDEIARIREVTLYPMFNTLSNSEADEICFCPIGTAAEFTNPSYHLPAFYRLWSDYCWEENNPDYIAWDVRSSFSRSVLGHATDRETGLSPDFQDYLNDGGAPHDWQDISTSGRKYNHENFNWDAWRVIMNIAVDRLWGGSYNETLYNNAKKLRQFFITYLNNNVNDDYIINNYKLDGSLANDQSDELEWEALGLQSMLATSAVLYPENATWQEWMDWKIKSWQVVRRLWEREYRTDQYRYFDNCLYMFAHLILSGNYRYENWDYQYDYNHDPDASYPKLPDWSPRSRH